MQTLRATSTQARVAPAGVRKTAVRVPTRVVCQASKSELAQKAAAAAASLPVLVASNPAFALVDERLNGDGTGLPFGVNEGVLGWVIFGALATVWAIWFNAQKDLGDFEDPDAGLKID